MYEKARHHAWAGLGFLSVILALRYFIDICECVFVPVMSFLILYITTSLLLTYIFRPGKNPEDSVFPEEKSAQQIKKKASKNRAKSAKKKYKNKAKFSKKKRK